MSTYAVIGASRGIGLEFVRQLAARPGATVFAVVRNPSTSSFLTAAISGLKNVHVLEADVVDYNSLKRAAEQVSSITGGKLDVLIHNAARTGGANVMNTLEDYSSMDELDADFIDAFKVNTLGVIHGISAFLPLLRASTQALKKVVVLGSPGGDLNFVCGTGGNTLAAYGITKASAHMTATKYAVQLKSEGFVVVTISPGAVDTVDTYALDDAHKEGARNGLRQIVQGLAEAGFPLELMDPEQSVALQLKTIDELTAAQNGLFLTHRGQEWSASLP